MTKLYTQNFIPFSDSFTCDEMLKLDLEIDPYERPSDKLGTHFVSFICSQKTTFFGTLKRAIYLDYYRKRIQIRGYKSLEGIVFEARGNIIKEFKIDDNDKFMVRVSFTSPSTPEQLLYFDSDEEVKSFLDGITDFVETCKKTKR